MWTRFSWIGIKGKMESSWKAEINVPFTQKAGYFLVLVRPFDSQEVLWSWN